MDVPLVDRVDVRLDRSYSIDGEISEDSDGGLTITSVFVGRDGAMVGAE